MEIRGITQTEQGVLVPQFDPGADIVELMANWLAQDNDCFDRDRFLSHVGAVKEER